MHDQINQEIRLSFDIDEDIVTSSIIRYLAGFSLQKIESHTIFIINN